MVVVRKNHTLQGMARVMFHVKSLPCHFWKEAINTFSHIHNRVTTQPGIKVSHYELWRGRNPNVKYFHVFGSKLYILANREQKQKLDPKSEESMFLGYSTNGKAYCVFNNRTKYMMESINVIIDDI